MKVTTVILIITKEDGDGRKRGDGTRSSLTPGSCPCKELWSKPTYHKVIMRMMIMMRTGVIIIFALRILDSMEVHILSTANPDGWNRAEEGLCSGQVSCVV